MGGGTTTTPTPRASDHPLDSHDGRIALYDAANNEIDNRTYSSPEEFQVIVGLLRNETPLWFDDAAAHLRTGFGATGEPTGEEEG